MTVLPDFGCVIVLHLADRSRLGEVGDARVVATKKGRTIKSFSPALLLSRRDLADCREKKTDQRLFVFLTEPNINTDNHAIIKRCQIASSQLYGDSF